MRTSKQPNDHLVRWLKSHTPILALQPIVGDASFRRYYRIQTKDNSLIAVEAPPRSENNQAFVTIAQAFKKCDLKVPEILQVDYEYGYLLLSDLGDAQLLTVLNEHNVQTHYTQSFIELIKLQGCRDFTNWQLPLYDHDVLLEEVARFHEWYLERHLGLTLEAREMKLLLDVYHHLIACAQSQPQVCVHRDYHSRNLMVLTDHQLGILDFQDAILGPVTYDLVSLLRDAYVAWPSDKIYQWVDEFGYLSKTMTSREEYQQWFDWMGLQRHLKILGTFARLYRRDNKANYLQDIPRILEYVRVICDKYPELTALKNFLTTRVCSHESNDISGGKRNPITAVNE